MQNASDDVAAWIGLLSVPGVGRTTFRKLVAAFGSPEAALSASRDELAGIEGLSAKARDGIASFPWRERADAELRKAADSGVAIVTAGDPRYPANLAGIPDAPLYLYLRGGIEARDERAIAIVGTRKPTHYGVSVAERIAAELAGAGFTIVSGLARGIDTAAHRGALAAGGRTIAVLGSGIDVPYPSENKELLEAAVRSGAAVSENPFGTQPESGYFPARNRIISGLSLGTVIIEAAEDSGSLITAKDTLDAGRPLFAVPGNVGSPASKGANKLIKQGARLVESAEDILAAIGGAAAKQAAERPLPPLTNDEQAVFAHVTAEPRHIDRIMTESGTTPGMLSGVLLTLELKGLVKQLPGKYYIKEA